MNTNPDETRLALWLDDELTGTELAEMDAWAAEQPEQLAAREELRGYKALMSEALPASEEPPYADFFLSRVNQGIRDLEQAEEKERAPATAVVPFWRSWLIPIAACAGMIFAFGIGRKTVDPAHPLAVVPSAAPLVYTPEEGVDAEWFASSNAGATVIVLQGVNAIPDSTDFSETVYVPTLRESDRMATRETESDNSATQ
jgi:hypothetical protein